MYQAVWERSIHNSVQLVTSQKSSVAPLFSPLPRAALPSKSRFISPQAATAPSRCARGPRMALSKLSGDEQGVIFSQLCNVLDPGIAVAFGSASNELRELTQARAYPAASLS